MEPVIKNELEKLGINVESALARFMGIESIFFKSLKLFLSDTNLEIAQNALQNEQGEEAYKAMHTIKGVCGNLSMEKLFNLSEELCSLLKNSDLAAAKEKFPKFLQEYKTLTEGLQKWI